VHDGRLRFSEVLNTHAGGLAWHGRYLYVANGPQIRVFDLRRVAEVDGNSDEYCGYARGQYHARGYRYVCPQVATLEAEGTRAYFSWCAIDRSRSPHRLLGGRYIFAPGDDPSDPDRDLAYAYCAWWDLDDETGFLKEGTPLRLVTGRAQYSSSDVAKVNRRYVQGALSLGDELWLSCSSGDDLGDVRVLWYTNLVSGSEASFTWAVGCEDLYYSDRTGFLWGLTEFENRRFVFAVRISDVRA
jgi:hypothetical protein